MKCYHQKVISFFSPWAKIIHFFAILKYLIVDFNFKYRLNKKKPTKIKEITNICITKWEYIMKIRVQK